MIYSKLVRQEASYETVANNLEKWLKIIQEHWGCKVLQVIETKVSTSMTCKSDQGFIILFDDDEMEKENKNDAITKSVY